MHRWKTDLAALLQARDMPGPADGGGRTSKHVLILCPPREVEEIRPNFGFLLDSGGGQVQMNALVSGSHKSRVAD